MRILMVCTSWKVFGAETMSLNILTGLKQRGHELVAVTSTWTDGEFSRRLQSIGIPDFAMPMGALVLRPTPRGIWWTANTLCFLPVLWRRWKRLLREFCPDVVVLTNPKQGLLLWPFLGEVPVYLVEHSAKQHDGPNKKMYQLLARKFDRFVATSEFMAAQLENLGVERKKICTIKIGPFTEGKLAMLGAISQVKLENPNARIRIGIAGQISPHKGHGCLVEAAKLLKARALNFDVVVFGEGDAAYVEQLKAKIRNAGLDGCWRWMGYEADLTRIYTNIDVCVVPSCFDEPFGMVAVEASAFGLPVIASRRGGLPEIVVHGESGWLVESNAPVQLADRLEQFIADPERARDFGSTGRCRVRNEFTIEKTAARFEALLSGAPNNC